MILQRTSTLFRILMIGLVIIVLTSLMGGGTARASTSTSQSSYIVQAGSADIAASLVQKYQGTVTSRLDIIDAVGALLTDQSLAQLRLEKSIVAITPNSTVKLSDDGDHKEQNQNKNNNSIPSTDYPDVVGADVVWAQGVNGSGVTVAVLDTGMGNLTALTKNTKNKPGRIVAWKDFIENSSQPRDPNGHGSHVAGIIANSQKDSAGEWNGVAPGVNLVGVRVLNKEGAGTYETVISGLQWVVKNRAKYKIRIVNLSLVSPVQSPYWADPLNQAVTKTWANGLTVIVAAGNDGPNPLSITVPGNNPYVVTVGAFTDNFTPDDWDDDYIAPFSGAGPTLDGFVKPDLIAPGAHMVSVVPNNSLLTDQYPANKLPGNYFKMAGTSQSTAVVSGIAALVLSKHPNLTPNQVKMRLLSTSLPWVDVNTTNALYSMWQQGAGRVNAPDAVFGNVQGAANGGMDIKADLAGRHYEGYSYYDEATGTYRLYDPFGDWDGGYGTWNGGHGSWIGGHGSWIGEYGLWTGGHGSWIGGHGSWIGGHGSWIGGHGSWIGGHGSWIGGYTTWAGGHGSWIGGHGSWIGSYADPTFVTNYIAGKSPNVVTSKSAISYFLQDP